ncbi:MAG: Leader peptidase (Prepilin peptidase) / N-methyltransferase [uncultured Sphingomonas sp.]|uniref:Prepilin leader peptidase/N-methyltransferase n=1 Tax=uncultured Sphingomonas sp. TaxID=158754 RepID=A0A6J4TA23_9SPHN|nr:A24 family peptidase [uncultured Sphingomonas sp.]CAA9517989.1 MAG: Leader peptidase (Prepilin peptidase) / N-methyltransferase [uncultured Sphingomonas sp.]
MTVLPALLGAVAGAIVGSYVATLCLRWPGGESASGGRSRCDSCGRTLRPAELIPLLSAAWSRGRCSSCGAPIAAFHHRTELAAAGIGAAALLVAPDPAGAAAALFAWLLLPLVLLDWRHFWLPDRLVLLLAAAGLALGGLLGVSLEERLAGGLGGFGLLWLLAWAYRRLRGREGLGAGDPKLFGAIGLWLGWQMLPLLLLGASSLGLAAALLSRDHIRPDQRLPFGTLLGVAAFAVAVVQARTATGGA